MNALFKNTCFYSKPNLLDMSKKTMKKSFVKYNIVFISLFLLFGIVALILGDIWTFTGIVLLLGAAFLGYRLYSTPQKLASKAYRRSIELYNSETETHTEFFEDYFLGKNIQSKSEIKINYNKVVCIKETENLLILILRENLILLVDKGGFSTGTKEEFIDFIKAKCPWADLKLK